MSENPNNETQDPTADRTPTERAEELLAQMEQRLSPFAFIVRRRILQLAARTREEMEDMWAEAQSIRQKNSRGLD